jgi:putative phosphoribosyl transferase
MQTRHIEVVIPAEEVRLDGTLSLPEKPRGVVVFVHGSGSSRHSPRNRHVAEVLHAQGIATLLFDLLTVEEDQSYETRFDIGLLTRRLLMATDWLKTAPAASGLMIGLFGASTGAAAALRAAAGLGPEIAAVVSRGGRPDLAGARELAVVASPTLLIVGGFDDVVIELNELAFDQMMCEKKLVIVPGATHLFEEPGTLDQAAGHAARWFVRWFGD